MAAARSAFAGTGYDGATIRGIAAEAGVDPSLVHHYFGTKEALFVAAVQFPFDPGDVLPDVLARGTDGLGERIVQTFLGLARDTARREAILAMIKSAVTHQTSAAMVREFISRGPLAIVAGSLDLPDARMRFELAVSHMVGLIMARHVLRLEPLAGASDEELVALVAPAIQHYFDV